MGIEGSGSNLSDVTVEIVAAASHIDHWQRTRLCRRIFIQNRA